MSGLPAVALNLLGKIAEEAGGGYRLRWRGSKIPRGATVGGVSIGWTQNGIVTGTGGERLGTYERVVEWGGPGRDEHEIMIYAKDLVVGVDGQPCRYFANLPTEVPPCN